MPLRCCSPDCWQCLSPPVGTLQLPQCRRHGLHGKRILLPGGIQARRTSRLAAIEQRDVHSEPPYGPPNALKEAQQRRREYVEKAEAEAERKRDIDTWKWGIRSAVSVCFVAFLVMDGRFQVKAHGYGILALITCINCSEQLQGDLFRKSMERFLGTSIGTVAAMIVLAADDFLVPEKYGWYARKDFYLVMIAAFTMAGVFTRSRNTMKPLYDYSFFLSVLSFDFLLLDSYKHQDQFRDGVFSILMVILGGLFTCTVGTLILPQFAGTELVSLTAETLEVTAAELEAMAAALLGCRPIDGFPGANSHSPDKCLREIQQMRQLASIALFELRFLPPSVSIPRKTSLMHFSAGIDWTKCIQTAEAAAGICAVCECVQGICEADEAVRGMGATQSISACPCEELVVQVVVEAMQLVQFCAASLRSSGVFSAPNGRAEGREGYREALLERHSCFLNAMEELQAAVDSLRGSHGDSSMKLAAVQALNVQLPARVYQLVVTVICVSDEGILEPPFVSGHSE